MALLMALTIEEIQEFITRDKTDARKAQAKKATDYYEAKHDIMGSRIFYIDGNGEVQEDIYRSNIKISHPFFTELCDQQVQYMLSGDDSFVKSSDMTLQEELDKYFDADFKSELSECILGTVIKGYDYLYAYKNIDDRMQFMYADGLGVIEIREDECDDKVEHIIYYYLDRIGKNQEKITRIQVWDREQTYYYVQMNDGKIMPDADKPLNPRPHIVYTKDGDKSLYYDGFGFIPFFRLDNNKKRTSNLYAVKDLIDDYDLMSCSLSNNLEDVNEALYVVNGFEGDNLNELITNIKAKKVVGTGPEGSVEIKTVDIPYQARQIKLELDEKNIYRFGMGFNSAQIGDGNITNIVIKSRYALLDLKCNKLEIRLKQFLRKIVKCVLEEINSNLETDYSLNDVYFEFKREVMTNASDNAQIELTEAQTEQTKINTLLNVASAIGNESVAQEICDILDLDYDEVKQYIVADPNTELNGLMNTLEEE